MPSDPKRYVVSFARQPLRFASNIRDARTIARAILRKEHTFLNNLLILTPINDVAFHMVERVSYERRPTSAGYYRLRFSYSPFAANTAVHVPM